MVNYGLNNNAQKIRSVRTLTDRESTVLKMANKIIQVNL
jgi:hypothetical protein